VWSCSPIFLDCALEGRAECGLAGWSGGETWGDARELSEHLIADERIGPLLDAEGIECDGRQPAEERASVGGEGLECGGVTGWPRDGVAAAQRGVDEGAEGCDADDERAGGVLTHIGDHTLAAERGEESLHGLTDGADPVRAAAATARDDQHLACARDLSLSEPRVGPLHGLRGGGESDTQVQGLVGSKPNLIERALDREWPVPCGTLSRGAMSRALPRSASISSRHR
jgi:hypothetical protein